MKEIERPESKQPIPSYAKKVFEGVLFDVYQWEQELFDGTKVTFERLKRPDSVVVFPVTDDGNVILTEQEQPGREPFIAAPGGRVDKGENVLDAAKRELLEETGYEATELILLDARHVTSKIDWVIFIFIAKGLKKVAEMNLDAGERISLKLVSFDEFLEIMTAENSSEKELGPKLFEARFDGKKREELRRLFNSK